MEGEDLGHFEGAEATNTIATSKFMNHTIYIVFRNWSIYLRQCHDSYIIFTFAVSLYTISRLPTRLKVGGRENDCCNLDRLKLILDFEEFWDTSAGLFFSIPTPLL